MTNPAIRFDLLRTLHAFIMSIPEDQFNLDSVVEHLGDEKLLAAGAYKECGAVACAMGWAALLPEFRRMGLHWTPKVGLHFEGKLMGYDDAASKLFGLPEFTSEADEDGYREHYRNQDYYAEWLFAPAGDGSVDKEIDDDHGSLVMSDHRLLFEVRMRMLFDHFGEVLVLPTQADSQP